MEASSWLAWLLLVGSLASGIYIRRRAPAISLGLLGGVLGALVGFGLAGVGEDPSFGTRFLEVGLVLFGLIGLAFTPSASSRFLIGSAVCVLALTPIAIWLAWQILPGLACRAWYSTQDRWCPAGHALGGTSGQITTTAVFVTCAFAGLLMLSAVRARIARGVPILGA